MNGTLKNYQPRKRGPMPSKRAILEHWTPKMYDPPQDTVTCWGCGFMKNTDRAHLNASCNGGGEELDNLVLLCRSCHMMQETICTTKEGEENFRLAILTEAPFMHVEFARLEAMYQIMNG